MARSKTIRPSRPWHFIVLSCFLVLVALTGGGARADIQSLAILRPASVLVVGFGFWTLRRNQFREFRVPFLLISTAFLIAAIHLIPLPPAIWNLLPGRALVAEVDRSVGLGPVWRPLSMVPSETWNALYALAVPLAVLVLAAQIARERRFQLLELFIGLGLASGLLGMLQVVGTPGGALYFYDVTNRESAVGLFSNRNHQAIFLACVFPMLAVYASSGINSVEQYRTRSWTAVAIGAVLVPLLLVTGSRTGLILGLLGLGSVPLLFDRPRLDRPSKRRHTKKITNYLVAGFAVLGLGTLTFLFSRAQAFERIIAPDQTDQIRLSIWGPIAQMAWKYFPVGSGIGSFAEVYQIDEPNSLLSPGYLNHAHNDWLELWMTGGVPAVALVAVAIAAWAMASVNAWRSKNFHKRDILFARLGSIILVLLAAGSVVDYPLRSPIMACFAVVAALWTSGRENAEPERRKNGGYLDHARLAP